jgi:hypothetical protein
MCVREREREKEGERERGRLSYVAGALFLNSRNFTPDCFKT